MSAAEPTRCPTCEIVLRTPAEVFLHRAVHAEPDPQSRYESWTNLRRLPFVLMPRVARLMQDYADSLDRASCE